MLLNVSLGPQLFSFPSCGWSLAWSLPYRCHLYMPPPNKHCLDELRGCACIPDSDCLHSYKGCVFFSLSVSAFEGQHSSGVSLACIACTLYRHKSGVILNCTHQCWKIHDHCKSVLHTVLTLVMYNYKLYRYNLYHVNSCTLSEKKAQHCIFLSLGQ